MEEVLTVRIPTEVQRMLKRTSAEMSRDIRLYAALMLFRQGKLSSGAAAAMAGVPRVMFLDLCADADINHPNDIPISQITAQDLRSEMQRG